MTVELKLLAILNACDNHGASFDLVVLEEKGGAKRKIALQSTNYYSEVIRKLGMPSRKESIDALAYIDLLLSVVKQFDGEIVGVEIVEASSSAKSCEVVLKKNDDTISNVRCDSMMGITLAMYLKLPLNIDNDLLERESKKWRVVKAGESSNLFEEMVVAKLNRQLKEAIKNEDYNLAAEISKEIKDRKNELQNKTDYDNKK